jgi:hypothetical protein
LVTGRGFDPSRRQGLRHSREREARRDVFLRGQAAPAELIAVGRDVV